MAPAGGRLAATVARDTVGAVAVESTSEVRAAWAAASESREWLRRLRGGAHEREAAVAELHALLLRAARFEVARRASSLSHMRGVDREDLAQQSADDALVAVLGKLDSFRGESRFTTWAYKFALYEAAVKVRREAWRGREVPLHPEVWPLLADRRATPEGDAESGELLEAIAAAIERELSPRQRDVLVSVVLAGVPIDVLAERLSTTRGALYKTLHDARRKLRDCLQAQGLHDGAATHAMREP